MDFEMEKVYNPQAIEDKLYRMWEESGAFVAHRKEGKKPFTSKEKKLLSMVISLMLMNPMSCWL